MEKNVFGTYYIGIASTKSNDFFFLECPEDSTVDEIPTQRYQYQSSTFPAPGIMNNASFSDFFSNLFNFSYNSWNGPSKIRPLIGNFFTGKPNQQWFFDEFGKITNKQTGHHLEVLPQNGENTGMYVVCSKSENPEENVPIDEISTFEEGGKLLGKSPGTQGTSILQKVAQKNISPTKRWIVSDKKLYSKYAPSNLMPENEEKKSSRKKKLVLSIFESIALSNRVIQFILLPESNSRAKDFEIHLLATEKNEADETEAQQNKEKKTEDNEKSLSASLSFYENFPNSPSKKIDLNSDLDMNFLKNLNEKSDDSRKRQVSQAKEILKTQFQILKQIYIVNPNKKLRNRWFMFQRVLEFIHSCFQIPESLELFRFCCEFLENDVLKMDSYFLGDEEKQEEEENPDDEEEVAEVRDELIAILEFFVPQVINIILNHKLSLVADSEAKNKEKLPFEDFDNEEGAISCFKRIILKACCFSLNLALKIRWFLKAEKTLFPGESKMERRCLSFSKEVEFCAINGILPASKHEKASKKAKASEKDVLQRQLKTQFLNNEKFFCSFINRISEKLYFEPIQERDTILKGVLAKMKQFLLKEQEKLSSKEDYPQNPIFSEQTSFGGCYLPIFLSNDKFLEVKSIIFQEAKTYSTKLRTPIRLVFEVLKHEKSNFSIPKIVQIPKTSKKSSKKAEKTKDFNGNPMVLSQGMTRFSDQKIEAKVFNFKNEENLLSPTDIPKDQDFDDATSPVSKKHVGFESVIATAKNSSKSMIVINDYFSGNSNESEKDSEKSEDSGDSDEENEDDHQSKLQMKQETELRQSFSEKLFGTSYFHQKIPHYFQNSKLNIEHRKIYENLGDGLTESTADFCFVKEIDDTVLSTGPDCFNFKTPNSKKQKSPPKKNSNSNFKKYSLVSVIAKAKDDLRQENLCIQIISLFAKIFEIEKIENFLRPYRVSITGATSGFIEFLNNTNSLKSIEDKCKPMSLLKIYENLFPKSAVSNSDLSFDKAQDNFIVSFASYCFIVYVLQIKDRHPGNILMDSDGHIIHIDFDYFLANSPSLNPILNFETAPFKILKEEIELMGGIDSPGYKKFVKLFKSYFKASIKHMDLIVSLVKMMLPLAVNFPCFNWKSHPEYEATTGIVSTGPEKDLDKSGKQIGMMSVIGNFPNSRIPEQISQTGLDFVDVNGSNSAWTSFVKFDRDETKKLNQQNYVMKMFCDRFFGYLTELELEEKIDSIINESVNSWRTFIYSANKVI